jgi:hypothetical protein
MVLNPSTKGGYKRRKPHGPKAEFNAGFFQAKITRIFGPVTALPWWV